MTGEAKSRNESLAEELPTSVNDPASSAFNPVSNVTERDCPPIKCTPAYSQTMLEQQEWELKMKRCLEGIDDEALLAMDPSSSGSPWNDGMVSSTQGCAVSSKKSDSTPMPRNPDAKGQARVTTPIIESSTSIVDRATLSKIDANTPEKKGVNPRDVSSVKRALDFAHTNPGQQEFGSKMNRFLDGTSSITSTKSDSTTIPRNLCATTSQARASINIKSSSTAGEASLSKSEAIAPEQNHRDGALDFSQIEQTWDLKTNVCPESTRGGAIVATEPSSSLPSDHDALSTQGHAVSSTTTDSTTTPRNPYAEDIALQTPSSKQEPCREKRQLSITHFLANAEMLPTKESCSRKKPRRTPAKTKVWYPNEWTPPVLRPRNAEQATPQTETKTSERVGSPNMATSGLVQDKGVDACQSNGFLTLYKVLEINSTATSAEVRKAYHKLARKYHPDKDPEGIETFHRIKTAFQVLGEHESRQEYDMKLSCGVADNVEGKVSN